MSSIVLQKSKKEQCVSLIAVFDWLRDLKRAKFFFFSQDLGKILKDQGKKAICNNVQLVFRINNYKCNIIACSNSYLCAENSACLLNASTENCIHQGENTGKANTSSKENTTTGKKKPRENTLGETTFTHIFYRDLT